jgi:hypothetical protein
MKPFMLPFVHPLTTSNWLDRDPVLVRSKRIEVNNWQTDKPTANYNG